jgi:RsiW-degrading membrane proteinase PrsW (M82 family)
VVPPPTELTPSPSPTPPAHRPYGWEWSRDASAGITRPSSISEKKIGEAPATQSSRAAVFVAQPTTSRLGLDLLAVSMALIGGLLALAGAFFQELQSGFGIFLLVLAAPVIEEVLKPSGIYLLLARWPQALRGQLHTALLCAVSGAVFGILESLIYVELYYPNGSDAFVLFRFTVTPIMHATASFIFGYGLSQGLVDWANGRSRLSKHTRNCYLLGIGLHATYNASVLILGAFGVLDFLETTVFR